MAVKFEKIEPGMTLLDIHRADKTTATWQQGRCPLGRTGA
jgi:hypothetical protein